jgi:two-component system, cell cycle response regulator DivK
VQRVGESVPAQDYRIEMTAAAEKQSVLVVEDNELNMRLFCDLLEAFGYVPVMARDGKRVVELAREHKPALIIMDIQLPEVSGLNLSRWIKAQDDLAHIPILAVTAFAMRQDERSVREAGCEGYMSKPIQMMPFIRAVQALTQSKAA